MTKFTAADVIQVYEMRRKTKRLLDRLQPTSLLAKLPKVRPVPFVEGELIKIRTYSEENNNDYS